MVYKIIQEIKNTRSRNEKEAILTREKDNVVLKEFFRVALNPYINFFQKKKFTWDQSKFSKITVLNLESAMGFLLNIIAKRDITGNAAMSYIDRMLHDLEENDAKVIMHILQKESGCDVGASTINKVWPKLIPTFPCLLATAWEDKLAEKLNWKKGVFIQKKSDGLRCNLVIDESGGVTAFTRAGNVLELFGVFDFLGEHLKSVVLDGELLSVKPNGKFHDRQTSNGICSKAVKNTMSESESETLHIVVWDAIPLNDFRAEKSNIPYSERFTNLIKMVYSLPKNNKISEILSDVVYSIEAAQEFYAKMIDQGEEGAMAKDQDMPWEDKRSKKQLKMKSEHTGDVVVTGYKDGVGELTGNLGSLVVESSDGLVVTNMSGFTLKLRSEIYANLTNKSVEYQMVIDDEEMTLVASPGECSINIGSIIEVKYNGKIKARNSSTWSLFLPRFEKTREDKLVPNSFKELK